MPKELPRYISHKEVQALKIKGVEWVGPETRYMLSFVEPEYEPIAVTAEWQDKHGAKAGGYFVRYKDGYESFSPAQAFEEGYTAVQG